MCVVKLGACVYVRECVWCMCVCESLYYVCCWRKYVHICVIPCIYVLCVYVGIYVYVYKYVYICVCTSKCVFGCMSQRYGPTHEIWTRSGFVFAVEPIHWRFEDRPMGWFGDSYRFVQWRPDDDSDPKPRHFMWVFAFVLFSYLPSSVVFICYLYHFMWPSDSFLSVITHTISCVISECSFYLYNWYEHLLASFQVLVIRRCWLRPSIDIPKTGLDLIINLVVINPKI